MRRMTASEYFAAYQKDGRAALAWKTISDRTAPQGFSLSPTLWVAVMPDGTHCLCWDQPDDPEVLSQLEPVERGMRMIRRVIRRASSRGYSDDLGLLRGLQNKLSIERRALELQCSPGARVIDASCSSVRRYGRIIDFATARAAADKCAASAARDFKRRQSKRAGNSRHVTNGHVAVPHRVM